MNAALQRKVSSRLNGGLMWEHAILAAVDCPFLFFHGDTFKNLLGVFRIVESLGVPRVLNSYVNLCYCP